MKLSLLASAVIVQYVSAHYFFDTLIIDGKETKANQYVRQNTRPAKYNPTKWENVRDDMTPDLTDFRCNKGAFESAGRTEVAEIKAGAKLAMKLAVGATMQHPGPGLVYMSKAPSSVKTYQGDGDWFKIFEEKVCNKAGDFTKDAWCTWDKNQIEFTVPAGTPDGEYLIRTEHIGVHGAHVGQAEFYFSCAQVKVTGGGSGTPGPTVKFPGAYKKGDPSFNFSIYGGFKEYPMPGPAVWTGGASGAAAPNGTAAETAPTATEAPIAPAASSKAPTPTSKAPIAGAQDGEQHCNGKKQLPRNRRAFRASLRSV
ncbi:putative endoglucanase [Dendryphion nanum]|uniref:AA9 family lytic polysaccharide monooxygenase n=1 Tax=Dendryphion nanum TaxID=256645 RepID=A0A9P9CZ52_9PLEO|nr:putative endoglucanase [Dendryphion nanum]